MDAAACARHAAEVLAGLPYVSRHFAVRLMPQPEPQQQPLQEQKQQQQPSLLPLPLPPLPPAQPSSPPPPPAALPELLILCRASTDACSGVAGSDARVDGLGASGAASAAGYYAAPPPPAPPVPAPPSPPPPAPAPPPPAGAIHLLADRLPTPRALGDVLRHELVHAVDAGVHGLDLGSCAGLACSEVRAAGEGACAGGGAGGWARRRCARAGARASVGMVYGAAGGGCVEAMFEACAGAGAGWGGGRGAAGAAEWGWGEGQLVQRSPVPAVEGALRREGEAARAQAGGGGRVSE
jgi:hypothetical protein